MYPFFRFGKTIVDALVSEKKGDSLDLTDVSEIEFRSSLTDMDNFFEMNNGRVFTLYDLGRTDLAVRTGLGNLLLKKRWGLVVAGSSIQYRKRIRVFEKVTMKTRVVAIDERWVYLEQSMWIKGQPASSALLRTGVTSKGKVLHTDTVLDAMGKTGFKMPPSEWVTAWAEADKLRPWPPCG